MGSMPNVPDYENITMLQKIKHENIFVGIKFSLSFDEILSFPTDLARVEIGVDGTIIFASVARLHWVSHFNVTAHKSG